MLHELGSNRSSQKQFLYLGAAGDMDSGDDKTVHKAEHVVSSASETPASPQEQVKHNHEPPEVIRLMKVCFSCLVSTKVWDQMCCLLVRICEKCSR